MSREILFRGKQVNGKWAYGNLVEIPEGFVIIKSNNETGDIDNDKVAIAFGVDEAFPVFPETVGQYTGLTLDGVKLFEGDLFKLTFSDGYTVTKVIKYISDKCQFCVANIKDLENEQYWNIWSGITKEWMDKIVSRCEVIGNIHEVQNER